MNKGLILQVHLFDKLIGFTLFRIFKFGLDWRGSEMGPYLSFIFGILNSECQLVFAWKNINPNELEDDFKNANRDIN